MYGCPNVQTKRDVFSLWAVRVLNIAAFSIAGYIGGSSLVAVAMTEMLEQFQGGFVCQRGDK